MQIEKITKAVVSVDGAISVVPYSDENVVRGLNTLTRSSCKGYHLRTIIRHLAGVIDPAHPRILDSVEPVPHAPEACNQIGYSQEDEKAFDLYVYPLDEVDGPEDLLYGRFFKRDGNPRKCCKIEGLVFDYFDAQNGCVEYVCASADVYLRIEGETFNASGPDGNGRTVRSVEDLLQFVDQLH